MPFLLALSVAHAIMLMRFLLQSEETEMKRGVDNSKVQQVRRALSSPYRGPPVFACANKKAARSYV